MLEEQVNARCTSRRRTAALGAVAVLLVAISGCEERRQCSSDSDCPTGNTCIQWKGTPGFLARTSCLRPCKSKADCQSDEICIAWEDHGAGIATCQQTLSPEVDGGPRLAP